MHWIVHVNRPKAHTRIHKDKVYTYISWVYRNSVWPRGRKYSFQGNHTRNYFSETTSFVRGFTVCEHESMSECVSWRRRYLRAKCADASLNGFSLCLVHSQLLLIVNKSGERLLAACRLPSKYMPMLNDRPKHIVLRIRHHTHTHIRQNQSVSRA